MASTSHAGTLIVGAISSKVLLQRDPPVVAVLPVSAKQLRLSIAAQDSLHTIDAYLSATAPTAITKHTFLRILKPDDHHGILRPRSILQITRIAHDVQDGEETRRPTHRYHTLSHPKLFGPEVIRCSLIDAITQFNADALASSTGAVARAEQIHASSEEAVRAVLRIELNPGLTNFHFPIGNNLSLQIRMRSVVVASADFRPIFSRAATWTAVVAAAENTDLERRWVWVSDADADVADFAKACIRTCCSDYPRGDAILHYSATQWAIPLWLTGRISYGDFDVHFTRVVNSE